MRAGQEFIDIPRSDANAHLARITKPQEPNGKKRLLKIPLILCFRREVLLVDMRKALAQGTRASSRNACLNFPYLSIDPKSLDPANLHFRALVASRVIQSTGIVKVAPDYRSRVKSSARALGVYKDYPLVYGGMDTTITVLPAVMWFNKCGVAPDTQHDYRKIRGETAWTPIEEATARLSAQAEEMPDNNLAQDAAALATLALDRTFEFVGAAQA